MKNRFSLDDVVEVSVTGRVKGISRDAFNYDQINYSLEIKGAKKGSKEFITVPESAIVHPEESPEFPTENIGD